MEQLYFHFTREGALQFYNELLKDHLRNIYNNHYMETKNPHYIKDRDTFYGEWLRSPKHVEFAKYTWTGLREHIVESQNDKVWDRLIDNRLHDPNHRIYKTLDGVLNDDAVQQELFTNERN